MVKSVIETSIGEKPECFITFSKLSILTKRLFQEVKDLDSSDSVEDISDTLTDDGLYSQPRLSAESTNITMVLQHSLRKTLFQLPASAYVSGHLVSKLGDNKIEDDDRRSVLIMKEAFRRSLRIDAKNSFTGLEEHSQTFQ